MIRTQRLPASPRRLAAAAIAMLGCALSSASAGPLTDALGGHMEPRCWSRTYDAAHLAANPTQRVKSIRFDSVPRREVYQDPLKRPLEEAFAFSAAKYTDLNVVMRNGRRASQEFSCSWRPEEGGVSCGGEADSGSVIIRPETGGRIRLTVPYGIRFGDEGSGYELTARVDREYILNPLPANRCRKPEV